ncbi:MAG: hypothetical protein RLY20_896 [Verrucomicrobiota bacterium]
MNKLSAGDWVEVRSKEEILRTLDKEGKLEGLPFMPEMFAYCGQRLRVFKRAHKTCDTVNDYKGRRMKDCVHLEDNRCDGSAHQGCQAGCLIFWKLAWLKPAGAKNSGVPATAGAGCTEADVQAATRVNGGPNFACQITLLPAATEPLPWYSPGQYIEDLTSGNVSLWRWSCGMLYMSYKGLANAGIGVGRFMFWLYDATISLRGGYPYPRKKGVIPFGQKTPGTDQEFQEGEWVRVKSYDEILKTLDEHNKNKGMYFDAEMVPHCGRVFRIHKRVTKIVNEKNGQFQEFKTPCYILEGGVCEGRYSECRLFCPRAIYAYWRAIWLEPASAPSSAGGSSNCGHSH